MHFTLIRDHLTTTNTQISRTRAR